MTYASPLCHIITCMLYNRVQYIGRNVYYYDNTTAILSLANRLYDVDRLREREREREGEREKGNMHKLVGRDKL